MTGERDRWVSCLCKCLIPWRQLFKSYEVYWISRMKLLIYTSHPTMTTNHLRIAELCQQGTKRFLPCHFVSNIWFYSSLFCRQLLHLSHYNSWLDVVSQLHRPCARKTLSFDRCCSHFWVSWIFGLWPIYIILKFYLFSQDLTISEKAKSNRFILGQLNISNSGFEYSKIWHAPFQMSYRSILMRRSLLLGLQ